jgi:uncharacterized repeat protein (TIGR01451 family)
VQTIRPPTDLPTIVNPVTIDGYSQPGSRPNTLAVGDDAILLIELDGAAAGPGVNGLFSSGSSFTIRGLVINRFSSSGIFYSGSGTANIKGNYIGTDAAGEAALPNGGAGVVVSSGSFEPTIGDTTPGGRNVISGNANVGILLSASGSMVAGNYIGTDASGKLALGNGVGDAGVLILTGSQNYVERNVISGNTGPGVFIGASSANQIISDLIGVGADGVTPLGNQDGVVISSGSGNRIVADPPGSGVIAYSARTGVVILPAATGNSILYYRIFGNGGLGIDLGNDGVTPNHPTSPTPGPNHFQNYPVLVSAASLTAFTSAISGYLESTPNHSFFVNLFANPAPDPSRHGQGETLLGTGFVQTDATGLATFSTQLPNPIPTAWVVSATATDMATGDTSEFSGLNVAPVVVAPVAVSTTENIPYAFGPAAFNVSDVDGAPVQQVTVTVTAGVLDLGSAAGLVVAGNGTNTLTLLGTLAALNAGLDTLIYVPSPGVVAQDTLTIIDNDQAYPALGGPLTDSATTLIDIHRPSPPPADLVVTKLASPMTVTTGQPVTYTVAVANRGPGASRNVVLSDRLPDGFVLASATSSAGTVQVGGQTILVSLPELAAGGSLTLTVVATPSVVGTFVDVASVADATDSPVTGDRQAMAAVVVTPPPLVPATVTSLSRYGFHNQPTALALAFSAPLDPATAQDLRNYQLVLLGAHNRPVRAIPIAAASYLAAQQAVVLQFPQLLALHARYRLTVNGSTPGGVADATGRLIDGAGTGQPGSDYVKTFGPEILVNSNPPTTSAAQLRLIQREVAAVLAREQAAARRTAAVDAALARLGTHSAAHRARH